MPGSLRRYQIVLLGPEAKADRTPILDALQRRVNELGDKIWNYVDVLEDVAAANFDPTAPVVAVWSGSSKSSDVAHLAALDALLSAAKPVIPIVRDITNFRAQTPLQLHAINGLPFDGSVAHIDRVINTVLEVLQLLRRRRRLFISYARKIRGPQPSSYSVPWPSVALMYFSTHTACQQPRIFKINSGIRWLIPIL